MTKEAAIRRILVGVDGSDGSARALAWAIAQARSLGAEVVAVHAFELPLASPMAMGYSIVPDLEAWEQADRRAFELTWCAPLGASGVAHRTVFRSGRAGPVLLAVAGEVGADLIVTGRRGLSTLVEMVAGSISQFLVHQATCPVVVVPGPLPAARAARAAAAAATHA